MSKTIQITCNNSEYFSYGQQKSGMQLIQRLHLFNPEQEDISPATLTVWDSEGFLLPLNKETAKLPASITVEVDVSELKCDTDKLIACEKAVQDKLMIRVVSQGITLKEQSFTFNVLPYDTFCGLSSVVELLAGYVNPHTAEARDILSSAVNVLKGWKLPRPATNYDGSVSEVRFLSAAIFRAVQLLDIKAEEGDTDYFSPVRVSIGAELMEKKSATRLDMALLFCSAVELAGLHPVIAIGKSRLLCGIWLKDNCFLESSFEDISELTKRAQEDINEIAVIDVENLFSGGKQNFAGAEKLASQLLSDTEQYSYVLDIKRSRIANYKPLAQRVKDKNGYSLQQILPEYSVDEKPEDLKTDIKNLKIRPQITKERQWERRLLDLSLKNRLLNFAEGKSAMHVMSHSLKDIVSEVLKGGQYSILDLPKESYAKIKDGKSFGTEQALLPISQLLSLEFKNGRLRTFSEGKDLLSALSALYRKDKLSYEETGSGTLFLAAGFLKWQYGGGREGFKYAPLLLLPIDILRQEGGKGFSLQARDDEYHFNTTLLEFLKQEFNVELRGLGDLKGDADIESVLAAVRRQILPMKGWEVSEDVYIASLSFARFLMWNDIRNHMDSFKKNKTVNALIQGHVDPKVFKGLPAYSPDDVKAKPLYLPISADISQVGAVAAAASGASFVLHGPPGTGKSQTITNIIANALATGKRVLFVAEKMAALSVVKKRLEDIGLGDFCLELHSGKSSKTDVAARLLNTLSLKAAEQPGFTAQYEKIKAVKESLQKAMTALHRRRALGLSVYEGILNVKKYDIAPDVMDVDDAFLDSLTAEKLSKYESMLSELMLVLQQCGQIYRSPFEPVEAEEFTQELPIKAATAIKVLQEEGRHLKVYAELCFEKLGNRVRTLNYAKLSTLYTLCKMLTDSGSPYIKIFRSNSDRDAVTTLNNFTRLYKNYQEQEERFNKAFKMRIELTAEPALLREELELYGAAYKKSRPLKLLHKRMERAAKAKIAEKDSAQYFDTAIGYNEVKLKMAEAGDELSALLSGGKKEKVNYNQVADIILKLNALYDTAERLFVRYEYDAFNKMLKNLFGEYPSAILTSFIKAYEEYEAALKRFKAILAVNRDYADFDGDYIENIALHSSAIYDNLDLLPAWIRYNRISKSLNKHGLSFALIPLKEGRVSARAITNCFKKKVYTSFVEREIAEDEILGKFSAPSTEERIERFKQLSEEYEKITRQEIYYKLIKRLPKLSTEGPLSLEVLVLQRAVKSNMRGLTLRQLFEQVKNLFALVCPCMLMSPISVAQYLQPDADMFDIVLFDEASQMPTSEAVGSIARAKQAIIVGDPKQLPPTSFFSADYTDEDNLQVEDLESILEDSLALGLPEKSLKWHYRSKHESLIAFSNTLYYDNSLSTFPSPDAMETKVQFKYIENGVYDRGGSKQNAAEADSLVNEVISRLKKKTESSIGIITFSTAQQVAIENRLAQALVRHRLEKEAYDREEPLFVKNLENVQGDERDIILMSICYGPDSRGKLSLNFGPLNHSSGWRRLNVAASRAREEMLIYASMTPAMINLSKNNSRGVAGIKALLEFADSGRNSLALKSSSVSAGVGGIGKYIARDLASSGHKCRYDLGVSDFKIDVAVVDPRDSNKFILAVMCDGEESRSLKDTEVLQITMLKRLNWNVMRMWTLNYFSNPKREVRRIKQYIKKLCGETDSKKTTNKFETEYNSAEITLLSVTPAYLTEPENQQEIMDRLKTIIAAEQPISREALIKKLLSSYGLTRAGASTNQRLSELLAGLTVKAEELNHTVYYRADDALLKCASYRIETNGGARRAPQDITPYEYVAAARYILGERVSLYLTDLSKEIAQLFGYSRHNQEIEKAVRYAVSYGAERGILIKSVSDMITL